MAERAAGLEAYFIRNSGEARLLHAISYGWISQSLLAHGPGVDALALRTGLVQALHAVLGTLERENPIENRL